MQAARATSWLLVLLLSILFSTFSNSTTITTKQTNPDHSTHLANRAIELLQSGQDASAILAELQAEQSRDKSQPAQATPRDDAQSLGLAISMTRAALRPILRNSAVSPSEAVILAGLLKNLQAQWLLYQLRFDETAKTLQLFRLHDALQRLQTHRQQMENRWANILGQFTPITNHLQSVGAGFKPALNPDPKTTPILLTTLGRTTYQRLQNLDQSLADPNTQTQKNSIPNANPIFGTNPLPQQRPGLIAPPLLTGPGITPSYASGENPPIPLAADLAPTTEATATELIRTQASQLGSDPVRIFDFVRTQIDTDFYPGSRKTADQVLTSRSGNDIDQASLLIALLRASRHPARYVRGVIELPTAELAQLIGVAPEQIGRALNAAGVPHEPVTSAGQIQSWRLEHTWVSAYVPYGHRGNPIDASAPIWLPLAPALKTYSQTPAAGLLGKAGIEGGAWVSRWLDLPGTQGLPLAALQTQLEAWLASQTPRPDYASQLASRSLDTAPLQLLPAGLPFMATLVLNESAQLDADQQQSVWLRLSDGDSPDSAVVLELKLPLSQLLNRRISLSYAPATVEDVALSNLRGSIFSLPAYLLRLRAQVLVDGQPLQSGTIDLLPGQLQRLDLEIRNPAGELKLSQTLRVGGLHSLLLSEPGRLPDLSQTIAPIADSETPAAALLWNFAVAYAKAVDRDSLQLVRLTGVRAIAPWPSASLVLGQYDPVQLQGLTERLELKGIALDAMSRSLEVIGADSRAESDFLHLSGLQASALEASNFESTWSVAGTSADRLLQQAATQNIARLHLSPGQTSAGVAHPTAIRTVIDDWLDRGYHVDIALQSQTAQSWSGSGYRVYKPDTGESGYFISGTYAGGVSIPPPRLWTLQQLVEQLSDPFLQPAIRDPQAAKMLLIDEETDRQLGRAGEILEKPLRVYAFDAAGRAVQGVAVKFEVIHGTARLNNGTATFHSALTDYHGMARMPVELGERLGTIGFEVLPDADSELEFHSVSAIRPTAHAGNTTLSTGRDFEVEVRAGEPVRLDARWPVQFLIDDGPGGSDLQIYLGALGEYAALEVSALDQFENRVANVPVSLQSTLEPYSDTCPLAAGRAPRFFRDSECPPVFAIDSDCGLARAEYKTRSRPLDLRVIPGTSFHTQGLISVTSGTLTPTTFDWADPGHPTSCGLPRYQVLTIEWVVRPSGEVPLGITTGIGPSLDQPGPPTSAAAPLGQWMGAPNRYTYAEWGNGRYVPSVSAFTPVGICGFTSVNGVTNICTIILDGMVGEFFQESLNILLPVKVPNSPGPIRGFTALSVYRAFSPYPRVPLRVFPSGIAVAVDVVAEPEHALVSAGGTTLSDISMTAFVRPVDYVGINGRFQLKADNEVLLESSAHGPRASLDFIIPRGLPVDPEKTYTLEFTLNAGTPYEIPAAPIPLNLRFGIISGFTGIPDDAPSGGPLPIIGTFDQKLALETHVDVARQRVCRKDSQFGFALAQAAQVEISIDPIDANGDPAGAPQTILQGHYDIGEHRQPLPADSILPGNYQLKFQASNSTAGTETLNGSLKHTYRVDDSRHFGHSLVNDINVFDGSFSVSRRDVLLPGRGPELAMQRSYSSAQAFSNGIGYLGWGWSSMLQQTVVPGSCDEVLVTGVDGSAQAFVFDRAEAGVDHYRGLNGVHGELQFHQAGPKWVYFALDGTRYEFGEFRPNARTRGARITAIEDPSGQRLSLSYENLETDIVLKRIANSDGRWLELDYARTVVRNSPAAGIDVGPKPYQLLRTVRSSAADEITYTYDTFGNLISVRGKREGRESLSEDYRHTDMGSEIMSIGGYPRSIYHGWKLTSLIDPRNQDTRLLRYIRQFSVIHNPGEDDTIIPEHRVDRLTAPDGGLWSYEYQGMRGEPNPLTNISDARDKPHQYRMNRYGAVTELIDPAGTEQTQWNDVAMKPASRTDRLGQTTQWTYDQWGNALTESISGPGHSLDRSWTYASPTEFSPPYIKNRIKLETDARGIQTIYAYDSKGRPRSKDRGGVIEFTEYASNGDLKSSSNGEGETTQFSYTPTGLLSDAFAPLGASQHFEYDRHGRKILETDGEGRTSTFEYDGRNRLTVEHLPIGMRTHTYSGDGHSQTDEDERGFTTVTDTDAMGRVVLIRKSLDWQRAMEYDLLGNLVKETDPNGNITTHVYNDANFRVQTNQPESRATTFTHDAEGHVLTETTTGLGGARTITREYQDPRYLVTKEDHGLGVVTTMEYDANGNLTKSIDGRGFVVTQTFDDRDRLKTRGEPQGKVITYAYDLADRPTSEVHNSGWRHTQAYDELGRITSTTDSTGRSVSKTYDRVGNMTAQIDRVGGTTLYHYDARNRLIQQDGPTPDKQQAFTYDDVGNLTGEVHANGRQLTHTIDPFGRRTLTVDQLGTVEEMQYDLAGNLLARKDANGRTTLYAYNGLNQRITQTAPLARVTTWTHTAWGEPLSQTDPNGGLTTFGYDAAGRKTGTVYPVISGESPAAFETWAYDQSNNNISHRDARGNISTSRYDPANRKDLETDPAPLSFTQKWAYDFEGNMRTVTDRSGIDTTQTWDTENRLRSTTRDGLSRQRLDYDGEGRTIETTDGLNRTQTMVRDLAGRVLQTRLPESIVRSMTYTPLDDLASSDDGSARVSTYSYDLRQRKIAETNAQGESTRFVYDGEGNLRLQLAPAYSGEAPAIPTNCALPSGPTHPTVYCYDEANRLTAVIDPENHRTQYEYDKNDNLTAVIEPNGDRSEFKYDARNRRIEKKSPPVSTGPPQVWTWTYDGNNNVLTQTDPVGTVTSNSYDVLNRITATQYTSAPVGSPSSRSYEYDANGNLTQLAEVRNAETFALQFVYDNLNRPVSITDANGRPWTQVFDAADQRTSLKSTGVPDVQWLYDQAGRATQITVTGAGSFALAYDGADRNTSILHPNGVNARHEFDQAGRITLIDHARNGGTVAKFQYQYDANGNRTQQIEENGATASTSTFGYDRADRLITIAEPGKYTRYTLDANSNRTETREGPDATTTTKRYVSTFDARNQIIEQKQYDSANVLAAMTAFQFDDNGNLNRQTNGSAVTQYQYDALDRLIETTPPTGPPTQYLYGPSDVRIAKRRGPDEVRYHYDGERLILESNLLGDPQKHYAYTAAGLLNTAILGSTPQHRSAHLDAQTSPVVVTANNGNIVNRSHFDPYGVETPLFGVRDQGISFQGYWSGVELEETGNLLSAARLYVPGLGVFGERDPVEAVPTSPMDFNPYLIGRSNPYRWLDPDGREAFGAISLANAEAVSRITPLERAGEYLGVDISTTQGKARAERYLASKGEEFVEGLKAIPIEAAGFMLDIPGMALDYFGAETGSLERMGEFASGVSQLVAHPYQTMVDGAMAQADAEGEARGTNNIEGLARIDGRFNAGIASAAVGALIPAGMLNKVIGKKGAPDAEIIEPSASGPQTRTRSPEAAGVCCSHNCFAAGTPVLTENGLQPIELVHEGDLVAARDEETGETKLQPVTQLFLRLDREVLDLQFAQEDGVDESITVTADHRFHSSERGWVKAVDLLIGEAITSLDGRRLNLVARATNPQRSTTYNFSVAENPNYFVGHNGLWVHNANCVPCGSGPGPGSESILDEIIRDASRVAPEGFEISSNQARQLRQNMPQVQRRSASQNRVMRGEFERSQSYFIAEWERQTGQVWPKGATPHHILPLEGGGSNKWYNLMPTFGALPNHSLPGIPGPHAKGGALRETIQRGRVALPPGTVTDLRRKRE